MPCVRIDAGKMSKHLRIDRFFLHTVTFDHAQIDHENMPTYGGEHSIMTQASQ